jgi:hypothetical protein
VIVRDCVASNNGDSGLNPNLYHGQILRNFGENNGRAFIESSSAFTQISQNYARGNGHVGIGVGGFTATGPDSNGWFNVITDNICVQNLGGIDLVSGTSFSIVSNNVCHANALYGIHVREESSVGTLTHHNLIHNNICTDNGKSGSGNFYGIMIDAPETRVSGNKVAAVNTAVVDVDTTSGYLQAYGILVYSGYNNELVDNDVRGHVLTDYSFEGSGPTSNVLQYLRTDSRTFVAAGSNFAPAFRQALEVQAALNFGIVPAQGSVDQAVAIAGAVVGSAASASPLGALPGGLTWSAYVSAAGMVTVRVSNVAATAASVGSTQWAVGVILPPV